MSSTADTSRRQIISWGHEVAKLLEQRAGTGTARGVEQAIDQFRGAKFQIAILGKAKRGKSTLVNALLGRPDDTLAPIDRLPASSAISRFTWAETEHAAVTLRDGQKETIPFARIRDYVTEESNPENRKGVDVVDVEGPFAGLDRDLTLIDTPGASSIHEHHDALLHAFIPQADAVIFLLTASMPIDQDELELLAQLQEADIKKIFFVLNKVDERSDSDIQDAIRHNQALLSQQGVRAAHIHLLSGKKAFEGDLASSGVPSLKSEIEKFLATHKGRVLRERFVDRVSAQAAPVLLGIGIELAAYRSSRTDLDQELSRLRAKKLQMESGRSLTEREFTRAWSLAISQFQEGLQIAKGDASAQLAKRIGNTSTFEVSKLAKILPTELNQILEDRLAPVAEAFERATREATERLHATYPSVCLGSTGKVEIRTQNSSELVVGLLGSGAAAAAGIGVAAVGSAAAAGIAAANTAALAATTTVAAPSLASLVLSSFPTLQFLAPLATGTATVAAPAALTATPLWVALAGPVGWTLAGVGILAVPFSWRLSKLKLKEKLDVASSEQVNLVFDRLKTDRVASLRSMGESILEDFRIRLDRALEQTEAAIIQARDHRPPESDIARLDELGRRLGSLLQAASVTSTPDGLADTATTPTEA